MMLSVLVIVDKYAERKIHTDLNARRTITLRFQLKSDDR